MFLCGVRRGTSDFTNKGELEGTSAIKHRCHSAGSFLRSYHSSVTKHIIDLYEEAKEDSKCALKIFRPETPSLEIMRINQ